MNMAKSQEITAFHSCTQEGGNSSITALLVPYLHLKKADSLGGNIFCSQYDHPVSRKSPERTKYRQLL